MNPERKDFLNLKIIPARVNCEETAWLLGFSLHDVPVLIAAGLLKPLGHPPRHGTKYFSSADVVGLRENMKWLTRASDTIVAHWRRKNGINPTPTTSDESLNAASAIS